MKRFVLILSLLLAIAGFGFAQTTPAKATRTKPTITKTTAAPGHLKKDGTPDMRYKANKEAVKNKPAGPTKKDGTADMRFKANKQAVTTKPAATAAPKKN